MEERGNGDESTRCDFSPQNAVKGKGRLSRSELGAECEHEWGVLVGAPKLAAALEELGIRALSIGGLGKRARDAGLVSKLEPRGCSRVNSLVNDWREGQR